MKKFTFWMALIALMAYACIPQFVMGAATAYITITATGAEIDISCNQTAWNVGTVSAADTIATSDNWAMITNNCSDGVDITIHGHDMKSTDNLTTWDLTDNGTGVVAPGFGMQATWHTGTCNITIREAAAFNTLVVDLASSGTQDFGMCFVAPTANVGNKTMEMVGETNSNVETPRGVCLTATIHV
jgi:hypothetical protein